jgi:hypothetical protein
LSDRHYLRETVTAALADFVGSATLVAVTGTVAGAGTAPGALYKPLALIVPTVEFPPRTPFTRQVTAVCAVFWTSAVNCLVLLIRTVARVGEIVTLTGGDGVIVTAATPTAPGTAWLVACTATVAGDGTMAGAVYRPVASIHPTVAVPPTVPFTSHVTVWSALLWTVAMNGVGVCTITLAAVGVTVTYPAPCRAWPECGSIMSGATSTASKSAPLIFLRLRNQWC